MGIQHQIALANKLAAEKLAAKNSIISEVGSVSKSNLKEITWLGEKSIATLIDNWVSSIEELTILVETDEDRFLQIITSPITRSQIKKYISINKKIEVTSE